MFFFNAKKNALKLIFKANVRGILRQTCFFFSLFHPLMSLAFLINKMVGLY